MDIEKKTEATAGDNIPSEYSYWSKGKIIGYWAYGSFDPAMPYQGRDSWLQHTKAVMLLRFLFAKIIRLITSHNHTLNQYKIDREKCIDCDELQEKKPKYAFCVYCDRSFD